MPRFTTTSSALAIVLCSGTAIAQPTPPAVEDELGVLIKSNPLVDDLGFSFDTLGSDFDTEIAIWKLNGILDADNDDAQPGVILQSSLNLLLPPGVYYTSISGFNTIFGPDFQADTQPFSEGGTVVATLNVENGGQIIDIDTTIAAGAAAGGEVKYYRFQIPGLFESEDLGTVSYDGFVDIDTCGSGFDTEIGVWNLDTGELVDFNDDAGDAGLDPCDDPFSLQSALALRLPTGRYALSVSGFGTEFEDGFVARTTNGTDDGSVSLDVNGTSMGNTVGVGGEVEWYTFNVLALPAGALAEGEPDCTSVANDINFGCSGDGSFSSISLGQTIRGTGGGGLNGDPIDLDWYELVITETTDYVLSVESEFDTAVGFAKQVVPGLPGCANVDDNVLTPGFFPSAFVPASISGTLQPGTYYIVISNLYTNDDSDCGSQYALTIRPQILDCPPGSYEELEPVPFDDFATNNGSTNDACIDDGDGFEDISVGDTVCGTTGLYTDSTFGDIQDQDVYRYNLAEAGVVEIELIATSDILGIATTTPLGVDPCPIFFAGGSTVIGEPGQSASMRLALESGDHSLNVLVPNFGTPGAAAGTPYIFSINEYDCLADTNLDGFVTPADFNAWIIAFNTTQGAVCDQNGDGLCTPADFNGWIINYNAGCDG